MAFGGTFNPFQQYSQPAPMQLPSQPPMQPPQQGLGDMKTQLAPTQQGYGNADPMALYSLYGLLGTGQKSASSSTVPAKPGAPQVPTANPSLMKTSVGSRPQPGTQPPLTPGQPPAGGTPMSKPGFTQPSSAPWAPGRPVGNPAPNPGNNPAYPMPEIDSYAGTPYQQQMSQYNSPEYAAYYNSLAPSTRAYMHAPGNQQMGQYVAQQWQDTYDAYNGNPWNRPPGG